MSNGQKHLSEEQNISNESNTFQSKDSIKSQIIYLSNKLLKSANFDPNLKLKYSIPKKIKSIEQVNSNLFVFFYEAILQNTLIGIFLFNIFFTKNLLYLFLIF